MYTLIVTKENFVSNAFLLIDYSSNSEFKTYSGRMLLKFHDGNIMINKSYEEQIEVTIPFYSGSIAYKFESLQDMSHFFTKESACELFEKQLGSYFKDHKLLELLQEAKSNFEVQKEKIRKSQIRRSKIRSFKERYP